MHVQGKECAYWLAMISGGLALTLGWSGLPRMPTGLGLHGPCRIARLQRSAGLRAHVRMLCVRCRASPLTRAPLRT